MRTFEINTPGLSGVSQPELPSSRMVFDPGVEQHPPADTAPRRRRLKIAVLGLSITSSCGNGHATTYRGLLRELSAAGHEITFLERDLEWHASNRDLKNPDFCRVKFYSSLTELKQKHVGTVRGADFVLVGSYVPQGAEIGEWVTRVATGATGFYDIDTPVTLAQLERADLDYLSARTIRKYDLYLSFTGGRTLEVLEKRYGSPMARPLYCSVDPAIYYPEEVRIRWELGYMGTYDEDRQPALDELLLQPARCWEKGRFLVAGPMYPRRLRWPANVKRLTHLPPGKHRSFYNAQRFTLNVTRGDRIEAGYSPSVRLFEAAACGTPIISDYWEGLESFFELQKELLVAQCREEVLYYLLEITDAERKEIGERARRRVLLKHTARQRARELEGYLFQVLRYSPPPAGVSA